MYFWLALSLGLLSGLHCISMCGPLLLAMPFNRSSRTETFYGLFIYQTGKALSYAIPGALAGFGAGFLLGKQSGLLSVTGGVLMLIMAFFPHLINVISSKPSLFSVWLKLKMGHKLKKGGNSTLFVLGFFNGLLPCGMVYMALASAVVTGTPQDAALFMFIFGLGTLPALYSVLFFTGFAGPHTKKVLHRINPIIITLVGLLLFLRGLQLGIPYVSPSKIPDKIDSHSAHYVCAPHRE